MRRKKRFDLGEWKCFLILAGILLCIYVLFYSQLIALGYRIGKAEKVYQDVFAWNQHYKARVLESCSPQCLKEAMHRHGLVLEIPADWAFVEVRPGADEMKTGLGDGKAEANTW